jgi:hypothetical protein
MLRTDELLQYGAAHVIELLPQFGEKSIAARASYV